MDKIGMLAEIYSMQSDLNGRVLSKVGVDYGAIQCSAQGECPKLAAEWVENYRKALSAEFVEYLVSDLTTKNAKIEVVDSLHFLVSLSQIVGMPPLVAVECMSDTSRFNGVNLARAMLITLDALQSACPYKWWAIGEEFDLGEASAAICGLWSILSIMMGTVNMDFAQMHDLYRKKNAVNHARQDSGYDVRTKTDEDNESIEVSETVGDKVGDVRLSAAAVASDSPQTFDYEEECRSEISLEEAVSTNGETPQLPRLGGMMIMPHMVTDGRVTAPIALYEPEGSDEEE